MALALSIELVTFERSGWDGGGDFHSEYSAAQHSTSIVFLPSSLCLGGWMDGWAQELLRLYG